MRSEEVRELRNEKLALYREHVADGALDGFELVNDLASDDAYADLLELVAKHGGPAVGLKIGSMRSIRQIGILRNMTLRCSTISDVLELWLKVADQGGELIRAKTTSVVDPNGQVLYVLELYPYCSISRKACDTYLDELVVAFHHFLQELTGAWVNAVKVSLSHRPLDSTNYTAIFGDCVKFGSDKCSLVYDASILTMPVIQDQLIHNDPSAVRHSGRELYDARQYREALATFFHANCGGTYSLAAAAEALGVSARTLSRHLATDGVTYGQILAEFRLEKARRLMGQGDLRTKQIAHLLGFKSENSLRVYIRTWTGLTFKRLQASVRQTSTNGLPRQADLTLL